MQTNAYPHYFQIVGPHIEAPLKSNFWGQYLFATADSLQKNHYKSHVLIRRMKIIELLLFSSILAKYYLNASKKKIHLFLHFLSIPMHFRPFFSVLLFKITTMNSLSFKIIDIDSSQRYVTLLNFKCNNNYLSYYLYKEHTKVHFI